MKKVFKYIFLFLSILTASVVVSASFSCRSNDIKEENGLIKSENNDSSNSASEYAEENDFTVFKRSAPDGKTMYHSFLIPSTWRTAKESSSFLGQESFTNNENKKYCLVSFTDIKNLEKLGIEKYSKSEKVFKAAIDRLIESWEKSGFILSNESKNNGSFILKNEKIQAYIIEKEEYLDIDKLFTNSDQKDEKQKSLLFILFIVYEEKYIGYHVLIDHSFDKEDNLMIIDEFLKSLEIHDIYSK